MISLIHAYLENRETFMENFIDQGEGFKKVEKNLFGSESSLRGKANKAFMSTMITLQRKGTLGRTNQILTESSHVSNLNLLNLTILLGVIILQFFI